MSGSKAYSLEPGIDLVNLVRESPRRRTERERRGVLGTRVPSAKTGERDVEHLERESPRGRVAKETWDGRRALGARVPLSKANEKNVEQLERQSPRGRQSRGTWGVDVEHSKIPRRRRARGTWITWNESSLGEEGPGVDVEYLERKSPQRRRARETWSTWSDSPLDEGEWEGRGALRRRPGGTWSTTKASVRILTAVSANLRRSCSVGGERKTWWEQRSCLEDAWTPWYRRSDTWCATHRETTRKRRHA